MFGPELIVLPDGRVWVAGRILDVTATGGKSNRRTSLCWLDTEKGRLHEVLKLPSAHDCGYTGMVYPDGLLWMSYYSQHEVRKKGFSDGETRVYLAKMKVELQND